MISTTVEAESGSTEVFGTTVSDLQTNVVVGEDSITGTLKYYSTADSQLVTEHGAGNFLALKFTPPEGATVKAGLDPSEGTGLVALDSDSNGVWKVTNNKTQVFVVETTVAGVTETKRYNLDALKVKRS